MIISRTPYRISFFGGGTDYPEWYEQHGGAVLATSIARYCYLTCRYLPPFFAHKHRIVYSIIESVQSVDEIAHPAVRECLRFLNLHKGLEIHYDGDLPKQTGLGTSSAFTVGLLHALHALLGEMRSPMELAQEAIHVERDLCGDHVGSQDQVATAVGGLNIIRFQAGGAISVQPVTLTTERLQAFQRRCMLFFTGFSRISSEIVIEQLQNIPRKQSELHTLQAMVEEGIRLLTGHEDLRAFGQLMHEGWRIKRSLSTRVSNPTLDALYETARRAGATGGKLTGAGGGGFLLLFVEPEAHAAVRQALHSCLAVPFTFDRNGSQIIVFQPNEREVLGGEP